MIGQTLGGRYEVLERVGGGGMALVYKARDLLLDRTVAVKVLRPQFAHDEEFVRRFRREARSAASLSHPNIVGIYDVGQDGDAHYIVMEYVEGRNLNEVIRERAPLQVGEAVRIAAQICEALEHAHQNQIIHRDIKPHNILIGNNGRVKVTDFGIARAVTAATITQTGSVVGSVHYFSPEHAKGVATGEKSDLYSLGIVLYQMLTGRLPFLGESPISVALKHLQESFEQPRKVNPHIPQSVENIILRAMRKNPQERYQSAREMLNDLETCLAPERLHEAPLQFADDEMETTRVMPAIRPSMQVVGGGDGPAPVASGEPEDETGETEGGSRRGRWVMPTVLSVMALIMIGALVWGVVALQKQLSPKDVPVPDVIGKPLEEAIAILTEAGLQVDDEVDRRPHDTYEEGIVIDQSKQGITVKEGSFIRLTVSTGPEKVPMPALTGQMLEDAIVLLKSYGMDEARIETSERHDDSEPGTVLAQQPAEGVSFDPKNDTVRLTVSLGVEMVDMPSLIGYTVEQARARIEQAGLRLPEENIIRQPSYEKPGTVFKQFPAEKDEKVAKGTEVTIWVSEGEPPGTVQVGYKVTVSPAEEGQPSTVEIIYSDAKGDNQRLKPRTIKAATTFTVPLVLSSEKDGMITVMRDGVFVGNFEVRYEDHKDLPKRNGTSPLVTEPSSSPATEASSEPPAADPDGGDAETSP
jgi:serine/threonine-protein kinase